MHRNFLLAAAAMVSTVAFAGTPLADDKDDRREGITALLIDGFANPVPTTDPCVLVNTEVATVLALDIGMLDWQSKEVVDLSSNEDCFSPKVAEIEGTFVMTAENGDQIFGTYETVARIDLVAAEISALGRYEITRGTGSFRRKKGEGVITALGDFAPPFGITGQLIAQPASDED